MYEQISWERNIAVMQLKDLGYGLGEKIRTDSDTISRQAAIDAIRASTKKYTGFMEMEMYTDDDAVEAIRNLSSAQPERWIPCNERLPEEEQNVLVTRYFILPYENENPSWYVEQAEYCDGQWYSYSDDHKVGIHYEPIAWMPLPQPYREGES